jgi:hypothetical protein
MLLCLVKGPGWGFNGLGFGPGNGVLAGVADKTGKGRSRWRASSYELTPSRWVRPRGRPADRSQASGCVSRLAGQAAPGMVCRARGGPEVRVDLAGDVTLEAADDLFLRQAFLSAAFDVGAGGRV